MQHTMPSASYARVLRTLALKVDRKKSSTPDLAGPGLFRAKNAAVVVSFFRQFFPLKPQ